jgi:hypothetical protein
MILQIEQQHSPSSYLLAEVKKAYYQPYTIEEDQTLTKGKLYYFLKSPKSSFVHEIFIDATKNITVTYFTDNLKLIRKDEYKVEKEQNA